MNRIVIAVMTEAVAVHFQKSSLCLTAQLDFNSDKSEETK